jgi:hypothetical protein
VLLAESVKPAFAVAAIAKTSATTNSFCTAYFLNFRFSS